MPAANHDREFAAIARGDSSAFARWLSAVEPELRRSLRPLARAVDAEAVLQEALLRIWQVAPKVTLDGRPNALLRLAVTTAKNLALSELRRARPDLPGDELIARVQLTEQVDTSTDPLLRKHLIDCREKLPRQPS